MNRRQLLKQAGLAAAAFAFSRDLFAAEFDTPAFHRPATGPVIKLSSNENPHGPSGPAKKAMMDMIAQSNRYPWETTNQLREKIAGAYGLTKDHVTVGAGSSELLGTIALMAAMQQGHAIAPTPTFRLWMPAAKTVGLPVELVPLTNGKKTDLQRIKDSVTAQTKMVYICNPNNPVGDVIPASELETFIKDVAPKCIVLLDEAYTEFSNEPSMIKWVNEYPNLVVAKTFSKIYGMAGARAGYAVAHPNTIKKLNDLQPWANAGISAVTLAGAMAAFNDEKFISHCRTENQRAKKIFTDALSKTGMPFIPSHTSFVYFDTSSYGSDVRLKLEKNNIIGCRTFEEGTGWRRLSIGTVEEMTAVAQVLTS